MWERLLHHFFFEIPKPRLAYESTRFPSPSTVTTQNRRTQFGDSNAKVFSRRGAEGPELICTGRVPPMRPLRLCMRIFQRRMQFLGAQKKPSLHKPRPRVEGGRWPGPRVERDGWRCYRGPRSPTAEHIARGRPRSGGCGVTTVAGGCLFYQWIRPAQTLGSTQPKFFENPL
jgi:hypothetical protein